MKNANFVKFRFDVTFYDEIIQSMNYTRVINCRFMRTFSSSQYDLTVIGAGPGGYSAAIKASHLGMNVKCIEKRSTLGGTCLNVGCIPSKALLHSSHLYHELKAKKYSKLGINCDSVTMDIGKMMSHKDKVVSALTIGIDTLFKANKISRSTGTGRIISPSEVQVLSQSGEVMESISTKKILIATGSEITNFPGIEIDEEDILSSTGALTLKEVPKRLCVIGGGVIGVELGSLWASLGSKVTVMEFADHIGGMSIDMEVSKFTTTFLKKLGINFQTGFKVTGITKQASGCYVVESSSKKDPLNVKKEECDKILVCIGRKPFVADLGLDAIGVQLDEKGFIKINYKYQTSVPSIYAVGDCVPGPMLAHKAEDEGIKCVEGMQGADVHMNFLAVPSVIYTFPEVAWVGLSEEALKSQNVKYKVGKFSLNANGRSRAVDMMEGFAKILISADEPGIILGAHLIAPGAGDIINQMAMAMEYGASAEDVAKVCHAHPTVGEVIKEACAAAAFGKTINSL